MSGHRRVIVKDGQELTLGKLARDDELDKKDETRRDSRVMNMKEQVVGVKEESWPAGQFRNDGRGARAKRKIIYKEIDVTSSSSSSSSSEGDDHSDDDMKEVTAAKPPMAKRRSSGSIINNNGGGVLKKSTNSQVVKTETVVLNGKSKTIKVKELELTSSEDDYDEDDNNNGNYSPLNSSDDSYGRAQSPSVPEGQYEIEDVVDYVKDSQVGDMYLIKWKNWESEFNTWEPPANLVNCDDALLNFYRKRKEEAGVILKNSEYYETTNGQRRRRGPPLPDIPPDPRPLHTRLDEFYECTTPISEHELLEKYPVWNKRMIASKGKDKGQRWPMSRINKYLQDGIDGKLSNTQLEEFKKELMYVEMERRKTALEKELKEWEVKINSITKERPLITVENVVDFEGPPAGFEFVTDYVPAAGIIIPSDPPVGCNCSGGCYEERKLCCAKQFGTQFAYTKYRKLAVPVGTPIYECNKKCKCSSECPNRVVQDGKTDCKLSIFRTSNGCGWGVKAMKSIKKGCFVTLYVGEVITNDEAEIRGRKDGDGHTYLFDLDFNDKDEHPYSVDASKYGNVAHFINHSCNPNLGVYNVWVDCLDPNLPKLAMFALRDIAKGEELSFDYINQVNDESMQKETIKSPGGPTKTKKKCLCGATNCRKFLFI